MKSRRLGSFVVLALVLSVAAFFSPVALGSAREDGADRPPPGTGAFEPAPKTPQDYGSHSVARNAPERLAGPAKQAQEPATREREFPWPPLKASAKQEVPDRVFRQTRSDRLVLADVSTKLGLALFKAGYLAKSYLAVPEGFALVTRLERIRADGTPYPESERWCGDGIPIREFKLSQYVQTLSGAEPGYFRAIAFVVTPRTLLPGTQLSGDERSGWLEDAWNRLPVAVSGYAYSPEYSCSAYVFEFEKGNAGARPRIPGRLAALSHLKSSGLWSLLEK